MFKKSFHRAYIIRHLNDLIGASKLIMLGFSLVAACQSYGAPNPFLSTGGANIRNNYGQGEVVPLHGVNLGSWLLMEGWMCPMDSSGLADNYSVIQTLDSRFGVAAEQSLIQTYQNTWITTNDLDNIKALGMNYIRLPFWWGDVQTLGGTWRPDAFAQMDWVVTNAWQRGIYTLIDFHGVPGGQSLSDDTGRANQNQYWTNSAYQNQTSMIWSNVAAHFNGNPAVCGYDLINEPIGAPTQAAIWSAYNSLYQTVRAADPNHIIVMEGAWSGTGTSGQQLNWQWDVLPPPAQYGWTNVVYSMHAYPGGAPTDEVNKQVNDFNSHQSWNVPCLIGEFNWEDNTTSDWQYGTQQFNANNMNWSLWSYKAISGSVPNSWGIYDPIGAMNTWPPVPNIQTNSINTISNDWAKWKTSTAFGATPFLVRYLGAPLPVADFYTNSGTLTINSNSGVLDNDQDINLGQPGISLTAVLVSNPANGQLVLNTNGSFTYTPNVGFTGTDTFRYRDFDGFVNSANIATVSILVTNNAAGLATQLIWTTQPGLATNGVPFGQQPVLQTADALGNPSTNSLPASLIVTVSQSAGNGPLLGTTNFDIGTAAGNGVVNFANLQINSAGANNQLTASVPFNPPTSLLNNGNFNSPNSAAAPTGWSTWTVGGSGYANHEIITANLTNGTASPPPNNTGNYDGTYEMSLGATAADGSGGGVYQIVSGVPNLQYTLIVDAGAQGWWLPTGQIRLIFLNSSSVGLATNVVDTTDSLHNSSNGGLGDKYDIGVPWQEWTNSAVSPTSTTQVKVEFTGYGGGTCWFDNAVLAQSNSLPALAAATTLPFTVYPPASQTNAVLNMTDNKDGTFTLNFVGTVGVTYYVQMTTNLSPPVYWLPLTDSTNTVANSSGLWFYTTTNSGPQSYFRSVVTY
jgi:aryl-phospho-beta-D-glucosidase BglC (GH1 family)